MLFENIIFEDTRVSPEASAYWRQFEAAALARLDPTGELEDLWQKITGGQHTGIEHLTPQEYNEEMLHLSSLLR